MGHPFAPEAVVSRRCVPLVAHGVVDVGSACRQNASDEIDHISCHPRVTTSPPRRATSRESGGFEGASMMLFNDGPVFCSSLQGRSASLRSLVSLLLPIDSSDLSLFKPFQYERCPSSVLICEHQGRTLERHGRKGKERSLEWPDFNYRLSYSSWRRHQTPVSLRPLGARSSH